MRKGVPVLADGERHPSTRKDSPESGQRFGKLPGVKLVSICTRARVGGRFWAICGAFGDMTKYTQKQLREMVKNGVAVDVTNAMSRAEAVPEDYRKVGYSLGVYGKNGLLLQGCESGKLYAVTARSSAVFMF